MDIKEEIKNLIERALKNLEIEKADFAIEHPDDFMNGDFSTNVALVLAKAAKSNPKSLAEKIVEEIKKTLPEEIEKVEVAGAGFINFYLSRKFYSNTLEFILNDQYFGENEMYAGRKVMVEYTDPNPFKPFHIGHLMTNAIGESIARILHSSGAEVFRANYQGDVGLHVAKAIWALIKYPDLQDNTLTIGTQSENIGQAYAKGAEAYESDPDIKKEIDEINKKIYDRSDNNINSIYEWGFKATMEAFEDLYRLLGTKFDYYFLESQVADEGIKMVKENEGKVFEKSDGAIVFKAENYDPKLHTRVFISSAGLPMYETKELGLTQEKFELVEGLDLSVVITANEQADYMKVVMKALSLINPDYEKKMMHIPHGMMRFVDGKMSSRKGNVITGVGLLEQTKILAEEKMKDKKFDEMLAGEVVDKVAVAAIKYSILKQSIGGDIIYDFEKSISFEGDSGPYLQYSYARAHSVLEKAQHENILPDFANAPQEIHEVEKLIYRFPEVVERSAKEYEPHYITSYLIELARAYNSFYGNNLIVDKKDPTSPYKVALTYAFSFVVRKGLHMLGIEAPQKM